MNELTFACSLSNTHVRATIKPYVRDFKWNSELADKIVGFFCEKGTETVDVGNIRAYLSTFLVAEEVDKTISEIEKFVFLDKKPANDVVNSFSIFYGTRRLSEIMAQSDGDFAKIITEIRSLPNINSDSIPCVVVGEMDVDDVLAEEIGGLEAFPSAFSVVKEATPYHGYLPGQVVQIVAPPGCVHGDTLVLTYDGFRPIKELVNTPLLDVVSATVNDLRLAQSEGAIEAKTVTRWFQIEFADGRLSDKYCEDHLIMIPSGDYVPVCTLKTGDLIASVVNDFDLSSLERITSPEALNDTYTAADLTVEVGSEIDLDSAFINKNNLPRLDVEFLQAVEVRKLVIHELAEPEIAYDIQRVAISENYLTKSASGVVLVNHNTGKSLFMLNEVVQMLNAGKVVYYAALGDMFKLDFIIRISSIITGTNYYEVSINPKKYYNDKVKLMTQNLYLTVAPAGFYELDALHEFMETSVIPKAGRVDVFGLDYDANLKRTSESMYEEGGLVYDKLTSIARPQYATYRLVFVASQPKIQFWDQDELDKNCSAESSKKQAVIDLMITMGKNPKITKCAAGIMKAAKVRRGKEGVKHPFMVTESGRIKIISMEEYASMKQFSSGSN